MNQIKKITQFFNRYILNCTFKLEWLDLSESCVVRRLKLRLQAFLLFIVTSPLVYIMVGLKNQNRAELHDKVGLGSV